MEERKQFCSAVCFKASNFFKDQLETSPLWLREVDTPVYAKLYTGKQEIAKERNIQISFQEEIAQTNDIEDATVAAENKYNRLGRAKEEPGANVADAVRSWFTIDSFRLVAGEERLREEVCSFSSHSD